MRSLTEDVACFIVTIVANNVIKTVKKMLFLVMGEFQYCVHKLPGKLFDDRIVITAMVLRARLRI